MPLPDYSPLLTNALEGKNFAALKVAATQAILSAWANPQSPVELLQWLVTYANNDEKITQALKDYLVFLVAAPALLQYEGNFADATLAELSAAIATWLGAFVVAAGRARAGV